MSPRHLSGSLSIIAALVNNRPPWAIPFRANIVDVRDVADAHVRALTLGADAGRYLLVGGDLDMMEMANVCRRRYPDRRWPRRRLPYALCLVLALFHPKVSLSRARTYLRLQCSFDASPAEGDLAMRFRPPEQSVIDSVESILSRGWT